MVRVKTKLTNGERYVFKCEKDTDNRNHIPHYTIHVNRETVDNGTYCISCFEQTLDKTIRNLLTIVCNNKFNQKDIDKVTEIIKSS